MSQMNLFNKNIYSDKKIIQDGEFIHIPQFIDLPQCDRYFDQLKENIYWQQEEMKIYGKILPFPRLTAWYGDSQKTYSFSGLTLQPNRWTSELQEIKEKVESTVDARFNSVLLNRYRDGNDSISWHQDDEKDLGNNPIIASVNFGATREFQLRHKQTREKLSIKLSHGSLLVLMGKLNHHWQHQVPKTKKTVGERINLTFRYIK